MVLGAAPKLNADGAEEDALVIPKLNGLDGGCDAAPNTGAPPGWATGAFEAAVEDVGGVAPKLKEKEGLLCPCALFAVV